MAQEKKFSEPTTHVNCHVPTSLVEQVDAACERVGVATYDGKVRPMSRSEFVREAMRQFAHDIEEGHFQPNDQLGTEESEILEVR